MSEWQDMDDEGFGDCLFGDKCTIAGLHTSDECVSVEMMEAYAEQFATAQEE